MINKVKEERGFLRGTPLKLVEQELGEKYHQIFEEEIVKIENKKLAAIYEELKIRVSGVGWAGPGRTIEKVKKLANYPDIPVLILGEPGTGKKEVARLIHALTPYRCQHQFMVFIPASVPTDLMESHFFGHKKGAYTGAHTDKTGYLDWADKGTLLLDEIGDVPEHIQVKLLQILEQLDKGFQEFLPLGAQKLTQVDIRFVFATSKNLEEEVRSGRFRSDLFYRINVVRLELPPLRDRRGDIIPLAEFFLEEERRKYRKKYGGFNWGFEKIHPEAMKLLLEYPWPGNVRELRNVITAACAERDSGESVLEPDHLINSLKLDSKIASQTQYFDGRFPCKLNKVLADVQKEILELAYRRFQGDPKVMAQNLDLSTKTLANQLKRFNIGGAIDKRCIGQFQIDFPCKLKVVMKELKRKILQRAVEENDGDMDRVAKALNLCKYSIKNKVRLIKKQRGNFSLNDLGIKLPCDLAQELERMEKEILLSVLKGVSWQQKKAAAQLGMDRTTLQNKIKKYFR